MSKIKYALAALLAVTIVVACGIATGSFTFGYELGGEIHSTNANLEWKSIDLTTIEDYNDHKDKLKSVDNVAIVGIVRNLGNTAVSGEVWLAYDSTYADYGNNSPDTVRTYATRIFVSPVISPGDSLIIDWEDGLSYIENFAEVQTAVELGQFVLYGLGDSQFFDVYIDVDIIFTITAGY
jgi:hypothetical protein